MSVIRACVLLFFFLHSTDSIRTKIAVIRCYNKTLYLINALKAVIISVIKRDSPS